MNDKRDGRESSERGERPRSAPPPARAKGASQAPSRLLPMAPEPQPNAGERPPATMSSVSTLPIPADLDPFLASALALPEDAPGADDGASLFLAVGLRLDDARIVDFDPGDVVYRKGERVVCEGVHGLAYGSVAIAPRRILSVLRLPRILRRATETDTTAEAKLRAREQVLWKQAKVVVRRANLPVKVVRAEAVHGGQRFHLYFSSEEKIQYRDLLRALGQVSRERIELRQVGARDAAKVIGGVGPCGLQLCCNTFLSDFAPVTIKMAKDQGLALNPQKVSGVCGRLLCCLVYEEAFYRAQRKLVPKVGERVTTAKGPGRVRDVDVLAMVVRVSLDSGEMLAVAAGELAIARKPSA